MTRRQHEFEQVALPHARGLLRFARRLTGNSGLAEDLVQESLLLAWRGFDQLQPETNARAWLYRILMNAWRGWTRKAIPIALPDKDISAICDRTHEILEVRQAVDHLPSDQRTALTLAVVEGFSCRETAEILGIPIGTVMSRLSRARQALRESLAERAAAVSGNRAS